MWPFKKKNCISHTMSSLIWLQMFVLDEQKVHKNLPVCVCVCDLWPLLRLCSSQHHLCHLYSWVSRGGGSLHPLQRIRQTLINWEECKQAAKTQDGAGRRGQDGGWMWVEERERKKGEDTPPPFMSCKLPTQEIDPESSRTMQRRSGDVVALWATDGAAAPDRDTSWMSGCGGCRRGVYAESFRRHLIHEHQ